MRRREYLVPLRIVGHQVGGAVEDLHAVALVGQRYELRGIDREGYIAARGVPRRIYGGGQCLGRGGIEPFDAAVAQQHRPGQRLPHVEEHHVGIAAAEGVTVDAPVSCSRGLDDGLLAEGLERPLVDAHLAPGLISRLDKAVDDIGVDRIARHLHAEGGVLGPSRPVACRHRHRDPPARLRGRRTETAPAVPRQTEGPVARRHRDALRPRRERGARTPFEPLDTEVQRRDVHRHRDAGIVGKDIRHPVRRRHRAAATGARRGRKGQRHKIYANVSHHRFPAGSSPANI